MLRALPVILVLAVAVARCGEDPIARIRARAAERTERTPNYTCLETIDRRWYADESPASEVVDRMRLEVAVIDGKEQFSWPGGSRFDNSELQEVLGRGLTKTGDFSAFVSSIFGAHSVAFTLAGERTAPIRRAVRYDYRVPQATSRYAVTANGQTALVGFHGSFWVDPETLDVTRVELQADDIPPALKWSSVRLATDYGLAEVGAGRFLLPQATEARVVTDHGLESRTRTRFSNCRQFLAESSISFEERTAEQAAKESDADVLLPPGVILEVELAAPIERRIAAIGDRIEAKLVNAVKADVGIPIPKGAAVEGRILRLETRSPERPCDLLALRFTRLRFGAKQVRLRASVIQFTIRRPDPLGSPHWAENVVRPVAPGNPMVFWGGFLALPKGFGLRLLTEVVPAP